MCVAVNHYSYCREACRHIIKLAKYKRIRNKILKICTWELACPQTMQLEMPSDCQPTYLLMGMLSIAWGNRAE